MILLLMAIGVGAGILSGIFGIGGGIVIVPALIYLAKMPAPPWPRWCSPSAPRWAP
jgi:uncharacterized membrane protein YfcA